MDRIAEAVARVNNMSSHQMQNELAFLELLNTFHGNCIACYLDSGVFEGHCITQCPVLMSEQKCLRCLSTEHIKEQCCNELKFNWGACYLCGLPDKLGGVELHPFNGMGKKCESR